MIKTVDICCGLCWGDEGKGKIVSQLAKSGNYDYVARFSGSSNAGHTIYKDGKKYKTNLIPSGIFYDIKSIIGPDCIVNKDEFQKELDYLSKHGFDTTLIKISPKTHVITTEHIKEDNSTLKKSQGSTGKGIAQCYSDKYKRVGSRVDDEENIDFFKDYIWDEKLSGNVLCEGAQGIWLDINYGNYPFVTSSCTFPFHACSLGFSPKKINKIYGACKIYDTRVGIDPLFSEDLLEDEELKKIGIEGNEYGVTTGRKRKVNWLNLNKLIESINISGCSDIIMSKVDILEKCELYKLYFDSKLFSFNSIDEMKQFILYKIGIKCELYETLTFSSSPETI